MRIIEKRRWRWGDMYGATHHGWKLKFLGLTVWQHKAPVERRLPVSVS